MKFSRWSGTFLLLVSIMCVSVMPVSSLYSYLNSLENERYPEKRADLEDKGLSNSFINGVLNLKGKMLTNQLDPVQLFDSNSEYKLATATRNNGDLLLLNTSETDDKNGFFVLGDRTTRGLRNSAKSDLSKRSKPGKQRHTAKVPLTSSDNDSMKPFTSNISPSKREDEQLSSVDEDKDNDGEGNFQILVERGPAIATDDKSPEYNVPDITKSDSTKPASTKGELNFQKSQTKYNKPSNDFQLTKLAKKRKRKEHTPKRQRSRKHSHKRMSYIDMNNISNKM